MSEANRRPDPDRPLVVVSWVAAAWALAYALYRAYYGVGGTLGTFGTPASAAAWRSINLVAAGLLLGAAVLPLSALRLWSTVWPRRVLLAAAWVIVVACIGHAIIDSVLRVLSLAGLYD